MKGFVFCFFGLALIILGAGNFCAVSWQCLRHGLSGAGLALLLICLAIFLTGAWMLTEKSGDFFRKFARGSLSVMVGGAGLFLVLLFAENFFPGLMAVSKIVLPLFAVMATLTALFFFRRFICKENKGEAWRVKKERFQEDLMVLKAYFRLFPGATARGRRYDWLK